MRKPVMIPRLFDLQQTLDCGQCFRWRETKTEEDYREWSGVAFSRTLTVRQTADRLFFFCSPEEYEALWVPYFDLAEDYGEKRNRLSALSPVLREAADFAPGIRILHQEPFEALCSFIISQNNHIPRIKGIIERLCALCGEPLPDGSYAFPGPEQLAGLTPEDLAPIRAGFRAKYLIDAAKKVRRGEVDLIKTAPAPVETGRQELQKIQGVGPKVAECALLYGFHKTECFPMDVWMKRAMETLLPGISPELFGADAGLAQQYLFHYSRNHSDLF